MTAKQVEKRRRILAAANQVFAAKGFEHSSIRDIALAARVADGTIYNYFANKQALLEALIADLITSLGQAESQSIGVDQPVSLEARVAERMKRLHDSYQQLAAVLPVILGTAGLRQEFLDGFLHPVLGALQAELGGETARLPARILMASVLGFQLLLLLGDQASVAAWDDPDELSKTWAQFIRLAGELSGTVRV